MIGAISKKIFGSRNDRILSKYQKIVNKINALEADYEALSDEELTAKTAHFKQQVSDGTSLDEILVDAFATVREASKRVMDMRHYDVQLIGGMALHDGRISEMRTGEGKTLVATLAVYLNALANKGVHVITVNDYLAQRDADLMSKLYNFLGLSTGVILSQMDHEARQQAYNCDITYGTNNEFGFDYLRDNMAFNLEDRVQRPLNFAIIDEVDSILIDEARTPLIISGPAENTSELYQAIDAVIPALKQQAREENEKEAPLTDEERGDFTVDEKSKQVHLTEDGQLNAEKALLQAGVLKMGTGLYDSNNINILHHLNAALRAHSLFRKDVDYIIANDDIVIVDEFTGRTMPGRRWSEGLHQAIEAKEGVKINPENQTMASITFQNFFRLYDKLSGMTGTADTEAFEFHEIYGLEVVVIPTNKDMIRIDANDLVYMTQEEKYHAIIDEIKYCQEKQQPVLVGTASIESSEILADLLKKTKIKYSVLNAKHHEQEAHIIENAGAPGAVTIATNMAGRGTDIMLGGSLEAELEALGDKASDAAIEKAKAAWQERHQQVKASGGLHIIGTERHESRRVDNQLRGRAGRQGDPGSSRFFLSLEDGLMRIFASERVKAIMQRLGMEKGQAIEAKLVNRSIENAQRKVESHNFDIRKNLLEYDDVANEQRKVIYQQRNETLEDDDLSDMIEDLSADVVEQTINEFIPPNSIDEMWNIAGLEQKLKSQYSIDVPVQQWLDDEKDLDESELRERLHGHVDAQIKFIEMQVGSENMRKIESEVLLFTLDSKWKEHLAAMDYLRQSVGLRGYAQKNPKQEYKREAFELFEGMLGDVKSDVITLLCNLNIQSPEAIEAAEMERQSEQLENLNYAHADVDTALSGENMQANAPFGDEGQRIGRNDPCPCGSGKKFKRCHGAIS